MKTIDKPNKIIAGILLALVFCILLLWLLFGNFIKSYQANITSESASHLIEINAQIKLYIEEKISTDWNTVRSIANSINAYSQPDMSNIFNLVQKERDIWQISDILIYTEDGYCISSNYQVKPNDTASEIVYQARKLGKYMTIVQSTVTYTIPMESELYLEGSRLAAVSIVQDLDSFIDNMGFSSFDNEAYIYLTQNQGSKISQLTHPNAPEVYNIMALFDGNNFTCLEHENYSIQEILASQESHTLLYDDVGITKYVVATPIKTDDQNSWELFYWVPESVVNQTMNSFSSYVTGLSFTIMGIFSLIALSAFIFVYRSRQKQFDSALTSRDRMFDLLVANTHNAFALLSLEQTKPLYVSSNVEKIIGDKYLWLEKNELGYQLKSPSGLANQAAQINAELVNWDGQSEFTSNFVPYDFEGQTRYYVMRIYPLENNSQEFIAIAQDITQERERENMLRNALNLADSANLAKTRFLANMSHDIRTPMNAIVNMTNFALESLGDQKAQLEYLNTIRDSSSHLLSLINDILDMSRIESGQTVITSEPFDLTKTLNELCEMIAPLYQAKKQSFEIDFAELKTNFLIGDQLKVSQILINLLNNAIKFTPAQGKISFKATEMPSLRPEIAALRFSIEDNGMGIAAENLQSIFEPFTRTENSEVKTIEGTGLGLSICQSYVKAMGGNISCQSQLGTGSIFTVELFFAKDQQKSSAAAAPDSVAEISFKGKKALLCEDNLVNQKIAGIILQKLGFIVEIASNGQEAVNKFTASPPQYYDIIYMDIQMPLLNGYEATMTIRRSQHPQAKTIPIIAMTANVFAEDIEKSRMARMNGHIGKPIVVKELIDISQKSLRMEE